MADHRFCGQTVGKMWADRVGLSVSYPAAGWPVMLGGNSPSLPARGLGVEGSASRVGKHPPAQRFHVRVIAPRSGHMAGHDATTQLRGSGRGSGAAARSGLVYPYRPGDDRRTGHHSTAASALDRFRR